jgi:hypothetical protein
MSTAPLGGVGEAIDTVKRRTIPFDVAFRYDLTGDLGRVLRNTFTVSIEAPFVAVSIGYGVVPKVSPVRFGPSRPAAVGLARAIPPTLRTITIGEVIDGLTAALNDALPGNQVGPKVAAVLGNGLKLSSVLSTPALLGGGTASIDNDALATLFQAVAAPVDRIQFRYALFDDATGREFQSEPILNIAGLGIANGDRPFRYFARPIRFAARSTIRLEITEESEFEGELHVSLQGYKVLGGASSPTGRALRRAARRAGQSRSTRRLRTQ